LCIIIIIIIIIIIMTTVTFLCLGCSEWCCVKAAGPCGLEVCIIVQWQHLERNDDRPAGRIDAIWFVFTHSWSSVVHIAKTVNLFNFAK